MIAVLFFGRMADLVGRRQIDIPASPEGDSLFGLRDHLLGEAIGARRLTASDVRMSLNRVVHSADHPVTDGDEVAFFSIFSGG